MVNFGKKAISINGKKFVKEALAITAKERFKKLMLLKFYLVMLLVGDINLLTMSPTLTFSIFLCTFSPWQLACSILITLAGFKPHVSVLNSN